MKQKIPNFLSATKNQRMLHFIIDGFFINMMTLIVSKIIDITIFSNEFGLIYFMDNLSRSELFLFYCPIIFTYFTVCELLWQKSFAKLFTKTTVVNQFGEKPTILQTLTRNLVRILPFEFLTFLSNSQGWHDLYSETKVVRLEKLTTYFLESK